jgi:ATP-dependent Clp protease ATP-binding subunit ClpC
MTGRSEGELALLRKLAEELAKGRHERVTTGHLLTAIASKSGSAADLLKERRLDSEVLLKAARVLTDDATDAVTRAMQRARDFAARSPAREPSALHLLFALCQERTTAAYRAIAQCGSDVAKLRTAAMQVAMGIVGPRRPPATQLMLTPQQASGSRPAPRASLVVPAPPPAFVPPAPPTVHVKPAAPPLAPRTRKSARHAAAASASAAPARSRSHARFDLDAKRFPTLTSMGKNLTLAAACNELDPVVGRDAEIERTLDVLAKRQANSPCLVGGAGVGKTSIVRGLARRIAFGEDVASLDDRIVIEIEAPALLAGTGVRGALAERIAQLKAEVKRAHERVVLFFDEIHALFASDAGDEATSELKLALAKGEIACIGATTHAEYKRVIESDAALARRFTAIEVDELSPEEAMIALEGLAPAFEAHHRTRFAPEALAASVMWSARYVPDRALPDKAVSILDLAGARARRRGLGDVGREQVAEVVSELAGVPVERLLETDGERMLRLEELMAARIVGHAGAIARIANVLRRHASGFRSRRPIGSFLLLGPTGVGKTETAKAIAECLFHSPHAMTRLDLSEYAEPHAIARLVGAPPGYVGHEAGGQLTEAVRKKPYQVVLLDEIEKAHRDVLEAFLQVFDEGRLTDGRGRTIDFLNTVILLTSNLGANVARPGARGRIGFGAAPGFVHAPAKPGTYRPSAQADFEAYEAALVAAARATLPPELYNRIDEVLAFAPLTRDDVAEVARRMLAALGTDLERARGVRLDVSDRAVGALLDAGGFDAELGARPMRRAIGRLVEAPIAEMILRGELRTGDVAMVEVEDGRVVVDVVTGHARATA